MNEFESGSGRNETAPLVYLSLNHGECLDPLTFT